MSRWASLAHRRAGDRVYVYEFTRAPPYPGNSLYYGLGATHGAEMPYVFDHLAAQGIHWAAADLRLARVMPDYWTRFARTGNPNGPGLPCWPQFLPQHPQVMRLGTEIRAEPIVDSAPLRRISLIYEVVRYVMAYWIAMMVIMAMMIAAIVAAVWILVRHMRLAKQENTFK